MVYHALGEEIELETHPRREPCTGCGEETAVGSVFFSSRRVILGSGDRRYFVCELCDERAAAHRHGKRMTDAELRAFIDNGTVAYLGWTQRQLPS